MQLLLASADNDNPQKVGLTIKQVDDPRFRVGLATPAELELQVQKPVTATIEVTWDEEAGRAGDPPPPGFLLEARLADRRIMHLLVPVKVEWRAMLPQLVLSPPRTSRPGSHSIASGCGPCPAGKPITSS